MKISYNYLKKFIDFNLSPSDLVSLMCSIGLESTLTNSFQVPEYHCTDVITVKIIDIMKHPNADKLSICRLSDKLKEYLVVCGAKNINIGQVVPLAKVGATLNNNKVKVKLATIRGISSEGMLCSRYELGLDNIQSSGILIFDKDTEIGINLEKIFDNRKRQHKDYIIDVDIASNRGDCLNYIGIAREIGAKIYKTLKYPNINYIRTERKQKKYQSVNLKICIQSNLCYRYIGTIVTGVKVSNSPSWLVEILNKSDIRSVNNIVDITNYVMLETGQPLHAFDLNNVYSKDFILRKALNQEEMIGIDNKRYLLNSDNLILSTRNNIISIAGIIGSKDFSVNSNTKSIFLESAIFDPITIRRTAKDLNIISQASYRFERNGTDWNMVNFASLRALKLIRKLSGGTVELRVDIKNTKLIKHNILLNCDKLYKLLGYYISKEDILEVLKYLGIKTIQKNNTDIKCSIPYWRNDIMEDVDLIEEISRIKGYDLIPYSYSLKEQTSDNNNVKMKQKLFPDIVQNMRRRLKCFGFNEVLNSSFIEKSDLNKFSLNYYHKIINPRAKENEILRPSLLPSIYKNLLLNLNHGVEHISLFEYGKIFNSIGENKHFAIIMYGAICEEWWKWNDLKLYPKYDFYFCGGLINHIISLKQIEFKKNSPHETYYYQGQVTSIFYKSNIIGQFGLLDPHLTENDNIHGNVFYCEIDIDAISHISLSSNIMYMQYSKFPFIKRDISIVADKTLPFSAIDKVIKYVIKKSIILKKYSLFSVYSDVANLGKNKKSYSIRLLYQHPHKTLTNKEVDQNIQYLLKKLNNSLDIKLR